jgi:MFS transporter, YNFM family, putative membrane transport protein
MQSGLAAAQSTVTRPIALLSAAAFCASSCLRITDPMLPLLAHDFRVSTGAASVVVSAFTLAYSLSQLAFGPIGDRFGKYRVLSIAMALSACTIAAGAAAQSLRELAALRLLAGITTAGVLSLALAYVGDVVAYEHRQAVLARVLSGQLLGVITGPAAGGILIAFVSWRVVFLVLGGIYACVAILLWHELRSGRVVQPHPATPPPPGRIAAQYIALLMGRRSRIVLLAIFLEGLMFFGLLAYFAAYLRFRFALDYVAIGGLLGCFGIGGLGYGLFARRIVPALGERGMMLTGGILLLAGLLLLSWMPVWGADAPVMAMLGFGLYMVHNTLQTNATQLAPEARGAAVSLFNSCFFFGQAIGAGAIGFGVDRVGYRPVFIMIGLGLLVLCWWVAMRPAVRLSV